MYVVTADQDASTRRGDRVTALLDEIGDWEREQPKGAVVLPLERTVGDEVQTVLSEATTVVDLALRLLRDGEWAVGIGAGPVDEPLASTSRASSGAAFVLARAAVERARGRGEPVPVVVSGANEDGAEQATAVVQLLAAVLERRTERGWEVADLLATGLRQKDVAARLGITEQAVSQRARAGLLEEERRVRPVLAALLRRAAGGADPHDPGSGGTP